MADDDVSGRAIFSECGRYRYTLERSWASAPRYVLWIMLNPSTADASQNDATIRRCIGYARAWGYTGILVGNLYAWRSTSPRGLYSAPDGSVGAIGEDNDRHLRDMLERASLLVCAWGQLGPTTLASNRVLQIFRPPCRLEPHALRFNASGEPSHPLRLAGNLEPVRWPVWDRLNALGPGHGG